MPNQGTETPTTSTTPFVYPEDKTYPTIHNYLFSTSSNANKEEKLEMLETLLSSDRDYFQMLNLKEDFTDRELKLAFRRVSKICHPDNFYDSSDAIQEICTTAMSQLARINDILSNPTTREQYRVTRTSLTEDELQKANMGSYKPAETLFSTIFKNSRPLPRTDITIKAYNATPFAILREEPLELEGEKSSSETLKNCMTTGSLFTTKNKLFMCKVSPLSKLFLLTDTTNFLINGMQTKLTSLIPVTNSIKTVKDLKRINLSVLNPQSKVDTIDLFQLLRSRNKSSKTVYTIMNSNRNKDISTLELLLKSSNSPQDTKLQGIEFHNCGLGNSSLKLYFTQASQYKALLSIITALQNEFIDSSKVKPVEPVQINPVEKPAKPTSNPIIEGTRDAESFDILNTTAQLQLLYATAKEKERLRKGKSAKSTPKSVTPVKEVVEEIVEEVKKEVVVPVAKVEEPKKVKSKPKKAKKPVTQLTIEEPKEKEVIKDEPVNPKDLLDLKRINILSEPKTFSGVLEACNYDYALFTSITLPEYSKRYVYNSASISHPITIYMLKETSDEALQNFLKSIETSHNKETLERSSKPLSTAQLKLLTVLKETPCNLYDLYEKSGLVESSVRGRLAELTSAGHVKRFFKLNNLAVPIYYLTNTQRKALEKENSTTEMLTYIKSSDKFKEIADLAEKLHDVLLSTNENYDYELTLFSKFPDHTPQQLKLAINYLLTTNRIFEEYQGDVLYGNKGITVYGLKSKNTENTHLSVIKMLTNNHIKFKLKGNFSRGFESIIRTLGTQFIEETNLRRMLNLDTVTYNLIIHLILLKGVKVYSQQNLKYYYTHESHIERVKGQEQNDIFTLSK